MRVLRRWVEHLHSAGFEVTVAEVADTASVRARLGLAEKYGSCHTAVVAGYVLEGHVPADAPHSCPLPIQPPMP